MLLAPCDKRPLGKPKSSMWRNADTREDAPAAMPVYVSGLEAAPTTESKAHRPGWLRKTSSGTS